MAATAKTKAKVKKKPIKAGHNRSKHVGGILNAKVIATAKKIRDE